ncbi:MAG: cell division protein FtsZ [Candidatus Dojkabacteria bacterium]|nr:cell division protein FtsZ [Candidatus Dojkabacteria bacterium]
MLIKPQSSSLAKIKVIGVGGGGGNAINNMINNYNIDGVEFIAVNTDAAALAANQAELKLRIGEDLTRGLGSGGDPDIGRKAAEESIDIIHENLAGSDMVFLTAGMGGGTGTGATPIIAGIARNLGALTIAIVTRPFNFEGDKRFRTAELGINDLKDKVDTLIVIPNQRILEIVDRNVSFLDAMKKVDDVLGNAVRSISNLITQTGLINVDFADVKSIMTNAGTSLMGMGSANGEDRATNASKQAIESPLLELSIEGATGVLFNVIGGKDLSIHEVDEAAQVISSAADPSANIIFGATIDPDLDDTLEITVLATGFDKQPKRDDSISSVPGRPTPVTSAPIQSRPVPTEKGEADDSRKKVPSKNRGEDEDEWLETPAFLRRKKD